MINKLDNLEEERILLNEQIEIENVSQNAPLISSDKKELNNFLSEYHQKLEIGNS